MLDDWTSYLTSLDPTTKVRLIGPLLLLLLIIYTLISNSLHLSHIPGPKLYALTKWRLAYDDWRGTRTRAIHRLHQKHGPVVRIGPNEISINSLTALKIIYGAGSGFHRTDFYRMFDVYGEQNLFTFASPKEHGERKKLLNHAYSKSSILKINAADIEEKVWDYMQMLEREPNAASEIFSSLHYYSLDNITHFLYGSNFGGTLAMRGWDRNLLDDVLDPSRRKLAWFAVHFPRYTKWLMSRTGIAEKLVSTLGLLPQRKPTVYTGIRSHALTSFHTFSKSSAGAKTESKESTIIGRLWDNHISQKEGGLTDMEIASEAADHLLAGVDTTADTLMFLIWALSRSENIPFQEKLIEEVCSIPIASVNRKGIASVEATGKLPYLDAVIKESLRLYAPLPASEPRSLPVDTVIDGYRIPANTIVSMSPFSLHRNEEVFQNPYVFDPRRWIGESKEIAERKKWFWAFSSGGRMCIGMHLAIAEMTTLTAAIYRVYRTNLKVGTESISPGITSRFEVFFDETLPEMKEHECPIEFITQRHPAT